MSVSRVTVRNIQNAQRRLTGHVRRTPLIRSDVLSDRLGAEIWLKLETLQETGSFKFRGAMNMLAKMSNRGRKRSVIAVSTGNHGRALAAAGQQLGISVSICLPTSVPANKVEGVRAFGADIVILGKNQDEAEVAAMELSITENRVFVSPFDHPDVISGQGTIGLELIKQDPELDLVITPLSGGGLISGVGCAVKALSPKTKVIGVSMDSGPAMYLSQKAGKPVPVTEQPSLADALGGSIGDNNRYSFKMVRDLVDDIQLVSERQIADAMCHLYREERQIAEGAGAIGLAPLLSGAVNVSGKRVAIVISGRNINMDFFTQIISGGSIEVAGH